MTGSVLIVTLPPTTGGVPTKTEILAKFLRSTGRDVTIASYATLSEDPELVVPSWRLLGARAPQIKKSSCFGDFPWLQVGCYLPELEFSYYRPTDLWQDIVGRFDRHIAVGGTTMVSNVLTGSQVPFFTWCASTVADDRRDRRAAMPIMRRLLDTVFIGPIHSAMERRLLRKSNEYLCVSDYTKQTLIQKGGKGTNMRIVPVPVDTDEFSLPEKTERGVIGFAGRVEDPRKNIDLLLNAMRRLIDQDSTIRLKLTGTANPRLSERIRSLELTNNVEWTGWLPKAELARFYQGLDVFVFPSHKEGLGISGVQAMACGVPVVSTRCGGPESYVIDGKTGHFVEPNARSMADGIWSVVCDRERRAKMGANARSFVIENFGHAQFEASIRDAWERTWGERL